MKKLSLKDRIIAAAKGGDEAKIAKFVTKVDKYLERQRKELFEAIEKVKDRIEDAEEALKEMVEHPDLDNLKVEGGANYVPKYLKNIQNQLDDISMLEFEMEEIEEKLEKLTKIEEAVYPTVKE